jgi:hypothetical protein
MLRRPTSTMMLQRGVTRPAVALGARAPPGRPLSHVRRCSATDQQQDVVSSANVTVVMLQQVDVEVE